MTQTLTTERMAEIAKLSIRLQQISGCAAVTSSGETIMHHTFVDTILSALHDVTAELLANREAQPVAVTDEMALAFHKALSDGCIGESDLEEIKVGLRGALCSITAPPSPAVPDECAIFNAAIDECRKSDSIDEHAWNHGVLVVMAKFDACRAAMLAQPQNVPQNIPNNIPDGCHWAYDEHDYKWDSGCGEAWMFSDGGPVENGVKFCQSCGKPVLLAAAPEGGST